MRCFGLAKDVSFHQQPLIVRLRLVRAVRVHALQRWALAGLLLLLLLPRLLLLL